jgi:hypothetical protein
MSTDAIRECLAEMDEAGFDPVSYLVFVKDRAGRMQAYWPRNMDAYSAHADMGMLLRDLNGAAVRIQ